MNNIAQQHKNGAAPEEITLYDSAPEFDEELQNPEAQAATLKFTQLDKQRSLGKKIVLYDNKQLSVSDYALKGKRQYWLNLGFLHPQAVSKWYIAWTWFGVTMAASALAAVASAIAAQPIFGIDRWTAVGIALLFFGVSILSAFALYRKSRHVLKFFSLNGKIAVLELLYNNPNNELFNAFSRQLLEKISAAQQTQHLAKKESLAAELAMHRQLMQNKIIAAGEYEIAKSRLFSMHNR